MMNKIVVRQYFNDEAKTKVLNLLKNQDVNMFVYQWLEEDDFVKCYFIEENDTVKCFSLLRKCDYDNYFQHTNPYVLNYIYTFPEYRNNKYAYKLLLFIRKKTNEHITAFCDNEISESLFTKAKFKKMNDTSTYRYP